MKNQRRYRINEPFVVSEVIDGEAVIMNLNLGSYYSARFTGELLWSWLAQGMNEADMVARLQAGTLAEADEITAAVRRFIGQLLEQQLIVDITEQGDSVISAAAVRIEENTNARSPFVPPLLEIYTNMQDLLLLDPIHDVTDVGWPTAKPTRPDLA